MIDIHPIAGIFEHLLFPALLVGIPMSLLGAVGALVLISDFREKTNTSEAAE